MSQVQWSSEKIRSTFIDFFTEKHNHTFWSSSPVIPQNDKTLLFVNAGMNQFKSIFLGQVDPKSDLAKLTKAVNSQKCIRAGGKHNDLDDVGKDTYHHTFFEMLGNWSFGDYFKKEAIEWSWILLTEIFGLEKDRLYATYLGEGYEGYEPDYEARNIWLKYLPEERIIASSPEDNFWEMGKTGPCGPCSEIHYDRIGGRDASHIVNKDDPNVIEIWNLVFMQFNREEDGSLKTLPFKNVDTGMGLERLTSILQGVKSNYDTDLFIPIFDEIQKSVGCRKYTGKVGKEDEDGIDTAYRVIADHIRTITIALCDGGVPDSNGSGYVLRRIIRRAVRFGDKIGAKPGFFTKLTNCVSENLSNHFPELKTNLESTKEIIYSEEMQFAKTIKKGTVQFNKIAEESKSTGIIKGEDAFELYATHGFPVDLTILMAEEQGLKVDKEGFKKAKLEAIEISKNQGNKKESTIILESNETSKLKNELNVEPTNDVFKYDWKNVEGTIKAIYSNESKTFIDSIKNDKEFVGIVLDKTSFYSTSGGQIHDVGTLNETKDNTILFNVENVAVYSGYVVHMGYLNDTDISLSVGQSTKTDVDFERRKPIASNHTSTHVLNYALRSVVGKNCNQRGSLVTDEMLRFDFSHGKGLKPKELEKVESIVRDIIRKELQVFNKQVPLEDAMKINGLVKMAEDYPNPVRVLSVGAPVDELIHNPSNVENSKYSIEFCGGTHLSNTKQAEQFVIVSEGSISKGTRRIIAYTKNRAKKLMEKELEFEKQVEQCSKLEGHELSDTYRKLNTAFEKEELGIVKRNDIEKQMKKVFDKIKKAQKKLTKLQLGKLPGIVNEIVKSHGQDIPKYHVQLFNTDEFVGEFRDLSTKFTDLLRETYENISVLCIGVDQLKERIVFFSFVTKEMSSKISASEWIQVAALCCDGNGGGKPEKAQGQGKDLSKLQETHEKSKEYAQKIL